MDAKSAPENLGPESSIQTPAQIAEKHGHLPACLQNRNLPAMVGRTESGTSINTVEVSLEVSHNSEKSELAHDPAISFLGAHPENSIPSQRYLRFIH